MDLIFQSHTKSIVKPPNQNLSTLMRVEPFMTHFNNVIFNSLLKVSSIITLYSGFSVPQL